jgi:hypothetical protein
MTMLTLPATYAQPSRQTRSAACLTLRLPFADRLVSQYLAHFLGRSCAHLAAGSQPDTVLRELDTAGLQDEALSMVEHFLASRPPRVEWNGRQPDLLRLAALAEDLSCDNGDWRQRCADLGDIAEQAATDLFSRTGILCQKVLRCHGSAGAQLALTRIRQKLDQVRHDNQTELDHYPLGTWSPARSEELRQAATHLRSYARPRKLSARLLLRFRPQSPYAWLLDEAQRSRIGRVVALLNTAWTDRHRLALLQARREALDNLCGRPGATGLLDKHLDIVRRQDEHLATLAQSCEALCSRPLQNRATELLLADSIQTVVDPQTRRTIEDLYDARLETLGVTPEQWAQSLRRDGLVVGGRAYLPHDWNHLDAATVGRHLQAATKRYLGYPVSAGFPEVKPPQTAYEHLAAVTMLDPELSGLLNQIVPSMVRRSGPYATYRPLAKAEAQVHAFLFCHPSQRGEWTTLFQNEFAIADDANAAAYAIHDPHRIMLCRLALAIPGGALHGLSQWMAVANEGYRTNVAKPLFNRRDYPEQRLLGSRVKSHADAQQMFAAAEKARLVHAIGNPPTSFILSRPDPRVAHLFQPPRLVADWHDAKFFFELVRNSSDFGLFVQQAFPHLADFPQTQARLAGEHDEDLVAGELVKMGILDRNAAGQYRLTTTPSVIPSCVPAGVYSTAPALVTGLDRDRFVAALYSHDELYNILFFSVRDAWQRHELSENDVPTSVRQFQDD